MSGHALVPVNWFERFVAHSVCECWQEIVDGVVEIRSLLTSESEGFVDGDEAVLVVDHAPMQKLSQVWRGTPFV